MIEVATANRRNIQLRDLTGNTVADDLSPEIGASKFLSAVVDLRVEALVMPDADDEVDFYIQTKLNGVWVDVANVHFAFVDEPIATADRLIGIGPKAAGVAIITPTDGTLADNTSVDIPLGEAVRIKTTLTGATPPTYSYEAKISLFG